MVVYTLGTGHYLSSRGGGGFLLQQRSTYVFPPYSVVLIPPHWRWKISWSSLFYTSRHKSQGCYMHASDIYINTYVSWTLNDSLTYLVIGYELNCQWKHSLERLWWRVTLLIQIVESKFIVAVVLLTVEFFLISHPALIPRHFLLWHQTIRLLSQTLWCVGNNDISGRSQVLLPLTFRSCHSQGCCI